jgi:hypothetical protein
LDFFQNGQTEFSNKIGKYRRNIPKNIQNAPEWNIPGVLALGM